MRTEIKGDNERAIREKPGKMSALEVNKLKGKEWQEKKQGVKEIPIIWEIKNLDKITRLQKSGLQCWLEGINRTEFM